MNSSKANKHFKLWHWPYARYSDGPEFACPHGVGHSQGVHGCEGCCQDPSFKKAVKAWKAKKI